MRRDRYSVPFTVATTAGRLVGKLQPPRAAPERRGRPCRPTVFLPRTPVHTIVGGVRRCPGETMVAMGKRRRLRSGIRQIHVVLVTALAMLAACTLPSQGGRQSPTSSVPPAPSAASPVLESPRRQPDASSDAVRQHRVSVRGPGGVHEPAERVGQLLMVGINSAGPTTAEADILNSTRAGSVLLLGDSTASLTTIADVTDRAASRRPAPKGPDAARRRSGRRLGSAPEGLWIRFHPGGCGSGHDTTTAPWSPRQAGGDANSSEPVLTPTWHPLPTSFRRPRGAEISR